MGSILRMDILNCKNLADILIDIKKQNIKLFSSSPLENVKKITDVDFTGGSLCVVGNEANGVSEEVAAICDDVITIPMLGRAESLNASVAAAVIMWEMLR